MRILGAAILASSFIVTGAFAASNTSAPLTPGKPAGVKKAQMQGSTVAMGLGLAVVGGGAALLASGNGNGAVSTTTSGTNP